MAINRGFQFVQYLLSILELLKITSIYYFVFTYIIDQNMPMFHNTLLKRRENQIFGSLDHFATFQNATLF